MIWFYGHHQQFNDLHSRFGFFWARLFCVFCCIMYIGPRIAANGVRSPEYLHPGTKYFTSEHGTLRVNQLDEGQKQSNRILQPGNFGLQREGLVVGKRRAARSLPRSSNGAKLTSVHSQDEVPTEYHASLNSPIATPGESEHLLRPEKCIPIEIPLCKNIGYNLTYMPNAFHHETQEEAGLEFGIEDDINEGERMEKNSDYSGVDGDVIDDKCDNEDDDGDENKVKKTIGEKGKGDVQKDCGGDKKGHEGDICDDTEAYDNVNVEDGR
ncbi:uncharacterized protein DEA37_0013391 [Paragonimus westermani]|uniref:FZ domain-containing protein n=1 Tax=Paragonimus westermani TaxID=34504 RepID=A0A5J4NY83_9TREM|nr:uncharacterized protein DEA37_0013391 [Paragonimus westermani]